MKRGMILVLLCLLALLAMSCKTIGVISSNLEKRPRDTNVAMIFDDYMPEEKTAQLILCNTGKVVSYNGIAVEWKLRDLSETIQIPAGNALLIFDLDTFQVPPDRVSFVYNEGKPVYKLKGMVFAYTFKPMKKYLFITVRKEGTLGLEVFEYEPEEKFQNDWTDIRRHFVEFVKFLNVRGADEKVILN